MKNFKKQIIDSVYDEEVYSGKNKFFPPEQLKKKISFDVENACSILTDLFTKGFNVLYKRYKNKKSTEVDFNKTISFLEIEHLFSNNEQEITEESLQKFIEISPETLCNAHNLIGEMVDEKLYEEARQALYFLVAIVPDFAPVVSSLGYVEYSLGNIEPAVRAYCTAFVIDPSDPLPLFQAAYCLNENGMGQEAIEYLDQVIEVSQGKSEFGNLMNSALAMKEFIMQQAA